jgi:hypothetical protein
VPVDLWDCEVYSMAMAEMVVGNMGWEAAAWEQWRQTSVQQKREKESRASSRRSTPSTDHEEIGAR